MQRGRFHVDDLSSAHVYLRLPVGRSIDDISADTLEDCAQLVKANSIQGNKAASVDVVYTPWANLRKTASMEVGQACWPINATFCHPITSLPLRQRNLHPVCIMSSSEGELWGAAQVGFRDQKQVQKISAVKRVNDVVNRLNRSKREAFPDLAAERDMYEKEVRSEASVDKVAALGARSA